MRPGTRRPRKEARSRPSLLRSQPRAHQGPSAQENAERKLEADRTYYEANKEQAAANQKKWRKENPERHRLNARLDASRRRVRKRAAGNSYTADDVEQMYADQGGLCAYCERELEGEYEVDHMIPLSREGANDAMNHAVACCHCNRSKFTKTAEEFTKR